MKNYRTKWREHKGFIIGFDKVYMSYGVWQKCPNWKEYNCVGVYHKTLREVIEEIEKIVSK